MKRASRTDGTGQAIALMEVGAPSLQGEQFFVGLVGLCGRMTQESTLYYSDNKIQKKKKLQIKTKVSRADGVQQHLGQVAVCVLLSIHSLQILLLYQDVDAFLSTRGRQSQHDTAELLTRPTEQSSSLSP